MRFQTNTLRSATVQILEGVLYSSTDEVVAELAPVLARKCGVSPALLTRLVTREAAWPAAVEYAARLERESAMAALENNNALPAGVIEVLFEKYGRSSSSAYLFARRSDLPLGVARKLAARKHRSVRHAISQNLSFPSAALWSSLEVVRESGVGGRYSVRAAWLVCEKVLRTVLEEEMAEYTRVRQTAGVIRVMPGARPPKQVEELLLQAIARDLVTSEAFGGWLSRGVGSDGIAWFLGILEQSERLRDSVGTPNGGAMGALCEYHPHTRIYSWRDEPTATQAVLSSSERVRAAAWAHPANAARIEELEDFAGISKLEIRTMSQNLALSLGAAREVIAALEGDAWYAHRLPVLEESDRLEILTGAGGRQMAGVLAEAFMCSVKPEWLEAWCTPAVFAAAIKAAGTTTGGSVLLEAAVTQWPEQLESFVENVKLGHMLGNSVTAAVLERVATMDPEAAKVVAGLIGDWDEPLAALVRAAESL